MSIENVSLTGFITIPDSLTSTQLGTVGDFTDTLDVFSNGTLSGIGPRAHLYGGVSKGFRMYDNRLINDNNDPV